MTAGFLIAGPVSGILSDRYGARPFATGGMVGSAICLLLLELLPVDFPYWLFAVVLLLTGLTMASFGSPNRAGVMNSLPPQHRGAGSGMNTTFQNSAQVLSIGIFFTLMIVGLMSSLPHNLSAGLIAHGVTHQTAEAAAHLSPVSTLFAAFLGYDPIQHLIGTHALSQLSVAQQQVLTGRRFFPSLISQLLPDRPARRPRLRHRGQPVGRLGLVAPGRPLRLLRTGRRPGRVPTGPRTAMDAHWRWPGPANRRRLGWSRRDDVSSSSIAQVEAG